MDVDRLAELALQLAYRVRTEDPDDNADWLLSSTSEADRWRLLFVFAAAGPYSAETFRRAKAWAAKTVTETVDDIAVERACRGEPLPLNRLEVAAAVRRMAKRGTSANETARVLGVDRRQVKRLRAGEPAWAEGVA